MITVSTPQLNCTAQSIFRNNDTHEVELKGNVHITISQDGQNVAKIVSNHVRLVPVDQ